MSYSLTTIQQKIHLKYEGSTDYPESGSEDYLVRLGLINDKIHDWEDEGTEWKELYKTLQTASDGDKTTVDGTLDYDCPTNFIRPSSVVYINSLKYIYLPSEKVLETQQTDPSKRFFYITGKPGTYKINLSHDPDGAYPIYYSYRGSATELASAADVPEMSRPMYIVNGVLADLYEQDNRNDMVQLYSNRADENMEQMILDQVALLEVEESEGFGV